MNQLKITFSDRVSTPQTIVGGSLKCTRDSDQLRDAETTRDTGYATRQKNHMIPIVTSIQAHENGGAIFTLTAEEPTTGQTYAMKMAKAICVLKRRSRDSFLSTITTNSGSCFVLHIFSPSIRQLPALAGKKIIRTCCPFHRVSL